MNTAGLGMCLISHPRITQRTSSCLWYSETRDQDAALIYNRRLRCWDLVFSAMGRVQRVLTVHLCILSLRASPASQRHSSRELPGSISKTCACFDLSSRLHSQTLIELHRAKHISPASSCLCGYKETVS